MVHPNSLDIVQAIEVRQAVTSPCGAICLVGDAVGTETSALLSAAVKGVWQVEVACGGLTTSVALAAWYVAAHEAGNAGSKTLTCGAHGAQRQIVVRRGP